MPNYHVILSILTGLLIVSQCMAETKDQRASTPHEVRIGWGDMLFETAAFPNTPENAWANTAVSSTYPYTAKQNHRYTGHIFTEYQYRILPWLGVGAQVDFEGIFWTQITRTGNTVYKSSESRNYNLVILPTVRFTYLHHNWINLYSGIGIGINTAFDNLGAAEAAPALNLNLLGMSVGNKNWFGCVELGLLNAMLAPSKIYMLGSRLLSISAGYRF